MQERGILGALIAFIFLFGLQSYIVGVVRRVALQEKSSRKIKFWDLIITREDNRYSLSRLQLYLWTIFVVMGYVAVCVAQYNFPDIPTNLTLLIGVNAAASVAATGIFFNKKDSIRDSNNNPRLARDIFLESDDSLDLPRTQMFVWTIVSLGAFTILLVKTFVDGEPALPDVPIGLVALMGLSHGAYLGTKAASKKEVGTEIPHSSTPSQVR